MARSVGETSDWISRRSGLDSLERAPDRSPDLARMRRSEGSDGRDPDEPGSVISNTPSSFVDPNRFFVARRIRYAW